MEKVGKEEKRKRKKPYARVRDINGSIN